MNEMFGCCKIYCTCMLATSILFFIVMIVLEFRKSEYLTHRYQAEENYGGLIFSLGITIIVDAILLAICIILIKTTDKKEEEHAPEVEYKFAYKIEKPDFSNNA